MKGGGKFGAHKTQCAHGHTHDSRTEAARCHDLHMLQRAGKISNLTVHPEFKFSVAGVPVKLDNGHQAGVKLDWQYFEGDQNIVEDHKPKSRLAISRDWPLRKAIFRALYPYITLRETR